MKFCPKCANPLTERLIERHLRPHCTACGFIHYTGPKVAVGVIISQNGAILLNRRDIEPGRGLWSFPSGYVDVGEALTEAAQREVREETGLEVEVGPLVGVYDSPKRPVSSSFMRRPRCTDNPRQDKRSKKSATSCLTNSLKWRSITTSR